MKDLSKKSDKEVVALALEDADSFLELMRRYEGALMRYLRRITGFGEADLEDVLQEVFIKVYRNLNGFDGGLKFSSWIYRIAHNHAISAYRKSKARPEIVMDEEGAVKLSSEMDVKEEVSRVMLREKVAEMMGKLDAKYRDVLVLRFVEDKSYREISDILKKSEGTVATLINRAKKKFKQIIYEESK